MAFDLSTARPVSKFDLSTAKPVQEQTQQTAAESPQNMSALTAAPLEAVQAFNNAAFGLVDTLGVDTVNAILQVAGSDKRVPRITDQPLMNQQYMEDGLARDAAQAVGSTAALGLGGGAVLRQAAQGLPKMASGAESVSAGIVREMGKSSAGQDLAIGGLAGAGQVVGGDVGESIGGAEGRMAGELVGSMTAPLAAPATASAIRGTKSAYQAAKTPTPENDIVQAGEQVGIPIMTTDVMPPRTFKGKTAQQIGEKVPVVGTGGMREKQQQAREKAVDEFTAKYTDFSYGDIVKSLKSNSDKVKKAAGSVLETTGKKLDPVDTIPLANTQKALQAAESELTKPGVIQSQSAIKDLQSLKTALLEQPPTFTALKENRTAFRELLRGVDKPERSQLPSRAKGLLTKVEQAMKLDMDAFAKANLEPREYLKWQRANQVYFDEATKLKNVKVRNVLEKGDFTPEKVETLLFSRSPSEVKVLYDGLGKQGRDNAKAAIISKVTTDLSKRAAGITPNAFASALKKYDLQTSTFFKGEDRKVLTGLLKALDATRRAQDAGVATPTGQQLLGVVGGIGAVTMPAQVAIPAVTAGVLARSYDSRTARSALLRLARTPKNSDLFDRTVVDVQRAFVTTAGLPSSQSEQQQDK